jgi:hypothetical protein
MMKVIGQVIDSVRRVRFRHVGPALRAVPRCLSLQARSEDEVRTAAQRVSPRAPVFAGALIRELVELNTPALFLNIVQPDAAHVVLRPAALRTIRFRGRRFLLDAGADAPGGSEAFALAPLSHVTQLFPVTPDHPVYIMSIEHQGEAVFTGDVPAYITHVTIAVNGRVVARAERLLRERGPQVFAA